jgi:hypothetical protein
MLTSRGRNGIEQAEITPLDFGERLEKKRIKGK